MSDYRAGFVRVLREKGPLGAAQIAAHLGVREKDLQTTIASLAIDGTIVSLGEEGRRTYCLQSQLASLSSRPGRQTREIYVPESMPLRPGALDHQRCGSLQNGRRVPYRPPVGMTSVGGM